MRGERRDLHRGQMVQRGADGVEQGTKDTRMDHLEGLPELVFWSPLIRKDFR